MRRIIFAALAGSLAVIGVVGLGFFVLERPTVLRVAVSARGESAKLVVAMQQAFVREAKNIRFKVVPVGDFAAASAALEAGQVDLSVVRTDIAMPPSSQTIAIFYREAAVLMAPAGSKLTKVSQLNGQRVGVLRGRNNGYGNINLLSLVLGQYDVSPDSVKVVPLAAEDLPKAIADHEIDVVLAVGVPTAGTVGDAVTALTQNAGGPPVFIPIAEASAISQRSPLYEAQEIVAGAFGGSPQRPVENIDTLGISVRLVAKNSLPDSVAADVARHIFAVRPMIAATLPLANRLQAPSTDKGIALPTHPGVVAYLDNEELTFLDRNGDVIYLGAMLASLIGSGFAAFATRLGTQSNSDIERHLERLLMLMSAARAAREVSTLDQIEDDAHFILASVLERNNLRGLEGHRASAFSLAFDRLCAVVRDKRMVLQAMAPQPAAIASLGHGLAS